MMETRARTVLPGNPVLDGVVAADGKRWEDVRRSLVPRYGWVWVDIGVRYALTFAGVAAACALGTGWDPLALAAAPVFAVWIGFWFASVVLFMHEAAHYNLHPDKSTNDRLADAFVCPLTGDAVASYRALHWQHHLHLGEPGDTEVSYHYAPTFRFLVETMVGLHALRVFERHQNGAGQENPTATKHARGLALARGLVVHGVIVGVLAAGGWYGGALAWILGVGVVFPYFSALRQQLEHRSFTARAEVDYNLVPHGAVNRMFGGGPLARSFGAAGFRQHLLHHWCPSVSYTNYEEIEEFFLATDLRPLVDEARTSYLGVWRRLAAPRAPGS